FGRVVVRWSRARKRYERQGILVEARRWSAPKTSASPMRRCAPAAGSATRRDGPTRTCVCKPNSAPRFARCSRTARPGRAEAIARHAATRGSGRIGRSAAGRALDPEAVRLAVAASVRHIDTSFDELLMSGVDRETARHRVGEHVEEVLRDWRATSR
ncbi:hypothetical protein TMLG_02517, partial [Mycobacterium tuberculosis SUMu012]